jgi:hypothetical protein
MDEKKIKVSLNKLVKSLKTQILIAKQVQCDFVYITVKEAKKCLELVEEALEKKRAESNRSEIVRCKECKYRDPEDKMCDSGHGIRWQLPREDDWFCADGKKREERDD